MKKLINLKISGMHCRSCSTLAKEELSELRGVSQVEINHDTGEGSMILDESINSKDDVMRAIERAGYVSEVSGESNVPEEIIS
jgi:P-type Cu+ transporter